MVNLKNTTTKLTLALWLVVSTPFVALAAPETITFLHVNDVYEITANNGKGGFAELHTLVKQERAKAKHSIFTFGGDLISPSVMSGLTKGTQMIELMNTIGVDVAVPGNHEFDFGPDVLSQRIANSKFNWLGSNVQGKGGMLAVGLEDTKIIQAGAYKVGFFGILVPETDVLSSPGKDISFGDTIETAKASVKKLQAEGANVIVALTHLALADDRILANSVKGLNLILGGHDHDPLTVFEGDVMIHKSGYDAHHLGVIDLTVDIVEKRGKKKLVLAHEWRMISTTGVTPDADTMKIVDGYQGNLNTELDVVIGEAKVTLDSRKDSVRTMESNIGNLIADAMRMTLGADVGLTNGGGIRANRTYDAGTKLTRKDILTELPFGNVTVLIELSGVDLLAALENGVSHVEKKAGRFPQVSGLTMVYDPAAPAGKRVVSVMVGGKAIDKNKTYKVATNDYIANGGDGYASLKKGKVLIDKSGATLMASTVINYVEKTGAVSLKAEGRIKTK